MKTLLLLPLLFTSLKALGPREEIQHAYRHQEWEKVEKLAIDYFKKFGTRDLAHPEHFGQLQFKLGVALWHQGKWQTASEAFEASYKKSRNRRNNPDKMTALWGWSDCAHRLGDYALSIRLAKKYLDEQDHRKRKKHSPFARGPKCLGYNPFFK